MAEFWFNNDYNNSLKLVPFKALYGCDPPHLLKGAIVLSTEEEFNMMTHEKDQMLHDLNGNLVKNKIQMKNAKSLAICHWVYLKLQLYMSTEEEVNMMTHEKDQMLHDLNGNW